MAKNQGPATSKDFFRGRDGKRGTDSHYGDAHGYGEGDNVHKGGGSKSGKSSVGSARTSAGGDAGSATEKTHNVEFAKGGSGGENRMFPEQAAESETDNGMAGRTGDPTRADEAPGKQFASGGQGKMFGFNPAVVAQAGITSAR